MINKKTFHVYNIIVLFGWFKNNGVLLCCDTERFTRLILWCTEGAQTFIIINMTISFDDRVTVITLEI